MQSANGTRGHPETQRWTKEHAESERGQDCKGVAEVTLTMSLLRVLSYAIEAGLSVQKEFYQIKIAIRKKIWKMLSIMLASKPAHGDSRQSKAKMIWFGDSNCFFLGLGVSEPSEMLPSLCLKTSLPMPPPCAKDYLTKTPTPDRRNCLGVVGQAGTRGSQNIRHVAITLGRHQR